VEPDETFTVNLSGAAGATIADSQGIGTITNDETGLAINDQSVAEGNSGTTPATFTVTRSGATTGITTVHYATADGSANAGSDYAATSGDLTFLTGETTKTIAVNVNGDTGVEPDETFKVNLAGAAGAALTDPQGTGTITNDDVAAPPKQETPANPLPILPALDKTAPGVSKLSLSNTRFRVGKTATAVAASAKVGTAFRYALTEPATVTIIIDSAKLGQTVRKSCVAPKKGRHAKRCTRYSFIGAITRRSGAGLNVVPFSGRIGTKALKPGNYRARLIATDGANNRSPISAKTFTVVAK
ncbi:MAG: hypothetical protein QOE08_117, partial [Thermoleophilaceae bacterium]|nr:hypothetical protein [Thermoleophilaceae bacterium]